MKTILLTAALLLTGLAAVPTASADCYDGRVTDDAACFAQGAADPVVRTCDTIGLVNLATCIVGQEVSNALAFVGAVCDDVGCIATTSAAKYGCDGTTFLDTVACVPEGAVEPLLLCYGTVEGVASCIVAGELANLQRFHERLCWHVDNCSIG